MYGQEVLRVCNVFSNSTKRHPLRFSNITKITSHLFSIFLQEAQFQQVLFSTYRVRASVNSDEISFLTDKISSPDLLFFPI